MSFIYTFTYQDAVGAATTTRATSNDQPVEFGGNTFAPAPALTHAGIEYDSENSSGQIAVTCHRDFAVAQLFAGGAPAGVIRLLVQEVATDGAAAVVWRGRLRACTFTELTAELSGSDGREALARLGLRACGGSNCQHVLYSAECGLPAAPNTKAASISSVSSNGLTLTVAPSSAATDATAGVATLGGHAAFITGASATTISLLSPLPGAAPGAAISIRRGCTRTAAACKALGNYNNFSGFDGFALPKNPFSEGVI